MYQFQSFLFQFPPAYIPYLSKVTSITITPWPRSTSFHHETLEVQSNWQSSVVKSWGRKNPTLQEVGLYNVGWRKHGANDCDWGFCILQPERWELG
jgi:hypothetical protein